MAEEEKQPIESELDLSTILANMKIDIHKTIVPLPFDAFADLIDKIPSRDDVNDPVCDIQTPYGRIRIWPGTDTEQMKILLDTFKEIANNCSCQSDEEWEPGEQTEEQNRGYQ